MKKIIILMCATALLSSCHIYKSYDRPEDITVEGLYRDTIAGGVFIRSSSAFHSVWLCFRFLFGRFGCSRRNGLSLQVPGCVFCRTSFHHAFFLFAGV